MARDSGWASLFWSVFKRSQNGMVLLDEKRRCVEVNGAYLRTLGYRRDALVGKPVWEIVKGGPLLTVEEWRAVLVRKEFTGEADLICADGTSVTIQYAAHPEVVTGRRLVLLVAINVGRHGRAHRRAAASDDPAALSDRERQIVHLVALGRSGPEIADELHIAHDTVRTHVRNAQSKLGARSRAQLVAMSLGDGHAVSAGH